MTEGYIKPEEKRTIKMSLQGCCGSGQTVSRRMTKKERDDFKRLAEAMSKPNSSGSHYRPYFYVESWDKKA